MSKVENNWQFATRINLKNEWHLFIREYQSSPTELIVSAINERLNSAETETPKEKEKSMMAKTSSDSTEKPNQWLL